MPGAISNDTPTTASAERIWGIYHITHPRSASNLFQNMMGQQPGFQYLSYKLFGAGFEALTQLQRGPLGELPKEDREKLFGLFEAGFEGMHEEIEGVVAGVSFCFLFCFAFNVFLREYGGRGKERERDFVWGGVFGTYVWSEYLLAIRRRHGASCESEPQDCVLSLGSHDKASDFVIELEIN